jgi:hypothetical protein
MQDENDAAGDRDLAETGSAPNVNPASRLTEASVREATDPVARAGEKKQLTIGGAGTGTSSNPARLTVADAKPDAGQSDDRLANEAVQVKGIVEIARGSKAKLMICTPPFDVERGSEPGFLQMIERAQLLREPFTGTPVPTCAAPYGSTDDLIHRIQKEIAAQTLLSASTSSLLSFWALSTWFHDALPLAPGLIITGPAFEGDVVLRTLRSFCRYPVLLTRADTSTLKRLIWVTPPTLLFFDPNISKQMVTIVGCSTSRGYLIESEGKNRDFYCPKAIYLGEQAPLDRMPHCSLHVHLNPARTAVSKIAPSLESIAQSFQNQLLEYRLKNLARVYNANFEVPTMITPETGAIVRALGACIVGSVQLPSELISLFGSVADQQRADRSTSPQAVTLEAILNLAHAGRATILVAEIAAEASGINHARGGRLDYSAEAVGHALKKVGVSTRRLGKAGKGLEMDSPTMTQLHELAAGYGVGSEHNEENLRCPWCAEPK